jgi:hypothetical protein
MKILHIAFCCFFGSQTVLAAPVPFSPPTEQAPPPKKRWREPPPASDCVTATMMITAPEETPVEIPTGKRFQEMVYAIHTVAIGMQIMDEREKGYFFTSNVTFTSDMNIIRRRHNDLKDVPMIESMGRFPSREMIYPLVKFNRDFNCKMTERMRWESDRADFYRLVLEENRQLFEIWDSLMDANSPHMMVNYRRYYLKVFKCKLEKMQGEGAFLTGELPDYVPSWRFAKLP